jgi:hypothetical protein
MSDQEGLKQEYFQAVDQDDSLNDDQKQQKKHTKSHSNEVNGHDFSESVLCGERQSG